MARMYVAFLLDFFQPSSRGLIIDEVTEECYLPLIDLFNCDIGPKFTVSMANSLAVILYENGKEEVLEGLRSALKADKAELVHTGAYHPIFPLIPTREVRRQIELDIDFKADCFGLTSRDGIFPPELCYEDSLTQLYSELGFRWTITDNRIMEMNGVRIPDDEIYHISDLKVLMRSSFWSDRIRQPDALGAYITGSQFVRELEREIAGRDRDCYKIVVLSAETFGHHVKYYEETFLRDMLCAIQNSDTVDLCLVSDLTIVFADHCKPKQQETGKGFTYFPRTSWATHPEDYARGDPYPHWKSIGNPIHEKLWELTNLIFDACQNIDFKNPAHADLRSLLDRAFYSTQYFWASIWFWNPEQIYEGIDLQMRVLYKCTNMTRNWRLLNQGQDIYSSLMWSIFDRTRVEREVKP